VAVLRRACAAVDVVVESFRPGVLDRLGLGFASLSADNPRLILCSISGFGAGGPLAQRAGHDLTYLARIGLLSLLAPPGAAPRVPGVQLADIGGGALAAAVSLLSALFARERDGRGRHLDVAMARGLVPFTALAAAQVAAAGSRAAEEDPLRGTRPAYRLYPTRDGRHMALAALEPKFFQRFCEVAGCSHLTGSGLTVGAEGAAVTAELERVFAARTLADWTTLLAGTDCCCEPVQTAAEATADTELGLASVDADGLRCLASPWHSADLPTQGHVPALGEHGREVARELGVDDALIEAALAAGAMLPGRERGGAAP
jgi:crotonobetainyl-CoA:carnitine CoA-transferase CaiB-like acyl-CoA transferase